MSLSAWLHDHASAGIRLAQLTLLIVATAIIVSNFEEISSLLPRIQKLAIPGVVDLELQRQELASEDGGIEEWAIYRRVSDARITHAKFDDAPEYLQIRADDSLDLAGAFVGDDSELRRLPNEGPLLERGDCVRIYTYLEAGAAPAEAGSCLAPIIATEVRSGAPATDGVFKADPGEGDRLVIFPADGTPVLDLDYWVLR